MATNSPAELVGGVRVDLRQLGLILFKVLVIRDQDSATINISGIVGPRWGWT